MNPIESSENINKFHEEFRYNDDTLLFLASKWHELEAEVFQKVILAKDDSLGYQIKTDDEMRGNRAYQRSLATLMAQGLIRKERHGTFKPYYPTPQGMQMAEYLSKERMLGFPIGNHIE